MVEQVRDAVRPYPPIAQGISQNKQHSFTYFSNIYHNLDPPTAPPPTMIVNWEIFVYTRSVHASAFCYFRGSSKRQARKQ